MKHKPSRLISSRKYRSGWTFCKRPLEHRLGLCPPTVGARIRAQPPTRSRRSRVSAELVMLLEWWSCTECTLFTDQATVDRFGKEHVVVILNHNFEIDFLCGWTMCERFGVLGVSHMGVPGRCWG